MSFENAIYKRKQQQQQQLQDDLTEKKDSKLEKFISNILNNDNEGYSKVKQRSSKPFLQKINK